MDAIPTLLLGAITLLLVLATLGLVFVNIGLVAATFWQVHLTQRSQRLAIRPLLADPTPIAGESPEEMTLFGPPRRDSPKVRVGELWFRKDGSRVSLPFRNIGAGVVVIVEAKTEPPVDGSVYVTRKFVPPGEHVRVNVSRLDSPRSPIPDDLETHWWAMKPFAIIIEYTDANGRQPLISRADFRQAVTQGPWVSTISIFEKGKATPFVVGKSSV